jgi:hypothetical protein
MTATANHLITTQGARSARRGGWLSVRIVYDERCR